MNPPDDAAAVREAIRRHLDPALAPHAVRRIEREIEIATAILKE